MAVTDAVKLHLRDAYYFGAPVLRRHWERPNRRGYATIRTRFGNFFVRPNDSDMETLRQVFIQGEYDLERFAQGARIRAVYEGCLAHGTVPLIVDAGANAGFAARFFALSYPKARILSVEPDPENAEICRANTADLPQVTVVEAALGSTAGNVALAREAGMSWGVRTRRAHSGPAVTTVQELQRRVPDSRLLIVKIDIEAFESDVFSTGTDWVAGTHTLIVEPHDWMVPGEGSSQPLQRTMLGSGRELLVMGENLVWVQP